MARRQIIELTDDLDGSTLGDDGTTVLFSLEGRAYEIDLSPENAQKLRTALAPFISAGRSVGRSSSSVSAPRQAPRHRSDLNAIREWARANGHTVSDRGRIAATIVAAYDKANA